MGNRFKSGFVTLIIFSVAVLLMATAAYAQVQGGSTSGCGDGVCMNVGCLALNCAAPETWENCPQDCPASCSDGFKNQDETGVDCGGKCFNPAILEVCDGKDNDRNCLVDDNCRTNTGKVVGGFPVTPGLNKSVGATDGPSQPRPSCHDGLQNQDELWDDCGGVCVTNDAELCDSKDNDKDCQVDEGGVCDAKANDKVVSTNVQQEKSQPTLTPTAAPESVAVPQPTSAPEAVSAQEGESLPAQPVPSTPAQESPTKQAVEAGDFSKLDNEQVAEQTSQIRQFAKKSSIYIPESEPDSELLKKYLEFSKKHEAEFEAKFQGKELTEKDIAEVLRQFSDETYPKPEPKSQAQSFFSKVRSFFKKLFS